MSSTILISTLSMAGLGLFFASVLAVVNQKLHVTEDPKIEALVKTLPGVNCGACGFASCHQYAEALAKGEAEPDRCRAGGEAVERRICEILGVEEKVKTKEIAIVHCGADLSKRKKKAGYTGIKTCKAAHNLFGGEIMCAYGCFGYGDCMRACPFGAITIISGLPRIDPGKCTACGKCATACPRNIITVESIEAGQFLYVACSNRDKGAETRKACPVGCIACGMCQKITNGIFHVEENLSRVEYNKLKDSTNAEEVVNKCPTKCIARL